MPKKPARIISAIVELDPQALTWGELRAIVAAAQDDDDAPVVLTYDERTDQLVGIHADLEV